MAPIDCPANAAVAVTPTTRVVAVRPGYQNAVAALPNAEDVAVDHDAVNAGM